MESTVTNKEKQDFIRWILRNHQLKCRECVWILNYIMEDKKLLNNIRFVENVRYCPKGMIMTTEGIKGGIAFAWLSKGEETRDADYAFRQLKSKDSDKTIYIEVRFPDKASCDLYWSVLEENPFSLNNKEVDNKISRYAEQVLNDSLLEFRRNKILKDIDLALDNKDEEMFNELTTILLKLNNG